MATPDRPLRILHVFRSPVGGLFRHVVDLVRGQSARGHQVGIVADSITGGTHAEKVFGELAGICVLGQTRIPMGRHLGPSDVTAVRHVAARIAECSPDIVHGHGAKGAAYARLAAPRRSTIRVYTPHGGSLLFKPGTLLSRFYIMLEKLLKSRTDLLLFESSFIERLYRRMAGEPHGLVRVVRNGVGSKEFVDIPPNPDATDILYIGELRPVKGVDVLIDAIADLRRNGLTLSATIVGDGVSRLEFQSHVKTVGLDDVVQFRLPMPAREAFPLGRLMVVPSRGESLPYIVLEIAAAGKPLVATNVGGIPDVFGPQADRLVRADDRAALAKAIADAVNEPETMRAATRTLRERIATDFSLETMVDGGLAAYREALARRPRLKSP